jgi:hypothetical protein
MSKPSDRVQLFTPEQAAAAFDGRADLTALVLKADIGQAETAAMIYVTKGDYTEPWPHQDPANRGTLLVPHQLDNVLQRLHEAWLKALLALGPGDRDLDPKSPEITALQGLALTSTDKRLHRNELRRWAALNGFEFDEFGATGKQTAPAKATPPTAQERQAERWQKCIDAGLTMPTDTYGSYPRGFGNVAKNIGINRQSLSDDLDKYRERVFGKTTR